MRTCVSRVHRGLTRAQGLRRSIPFSQNWVKGSASRSAPVAPPTTARPSGAKPIWDTTRSLTCRRSSSDPAPWNIAIISGDFPCHGGVLVRAKPLHRILSSGCFIHLKFSFLEDNETSSFGQTNGPFLDLVCPPCPDGAERRNCVLSDHHPELAQAIQPKVQVLC